MHTLPAELFAQHLPVAKSLLKELVETESPSDDPAAVNRLGERIIREIQALQGNVQVYPQETAGSHIIGRWGQGDQGILVLCHMDTVYSLGTLAQRPYHEEGDKLIGPGVQDMKSGIAILLSALQIFHQQNIWPRQPITALFTSDEEVGSLTSRALIESEASRAGVVFCMEPALSNGALKTARKGTGDIEIWVKGVAAHAGGDHEKGRNAIEELAHHILDAQKLTDYSQGTTVNVGVVRGGTRGNVVPDEAYTLIDFRVTNLNEYQRLEQWANHLTPRINGTQLTASITLNRPPMPRSEIMAQAFQKAQAIGSAIGLHLTEGSTGGGSDANFAAPFGVPILDGLGALGHGEHSEYEYIFTDSLSEKTALLAHLMLNW